MEFEKKYEAVLQNIEAMIAQVYREHDESFSDHAVSRALEAAIEEVVAIKIKREPRDFNLNEVRNGYSTGNYDHLFLAIGNGWAGG
jgi:hypothetical protein